ncbi:uncharacterized protein [Nicotiana tomentosiformis]|uniref:uncharacterized protein n=1 Tax=Nicotiana tomentosiformis TaxID=4098 RepID=UPI00388C3452
MARDFEGPVGGLSKDVAMRPPSGDDDILTKPSSPRQDKEKKRKRAPSSPSSEKKKPRKRLARKPKKSTSARASVLHHETFLRYRDELKQLKAKVRELTEKRDAFKLLSEEIEWEVKNLRAKLEVARKEHADLVEQLRAAKERAEVQIKKVEELQSRLGSAVSDRESLAKELRTAKSEVIVVKAEADEMVAQYKAHAEAAQDLVKTIVEHIKWQSRREALEEVHFRGFDLSAEIKNAKVLEAEARKLAYAEEEDSEESEDLGKSEGGGGPEGDDAAPDED